MQLVLGENESADQPQNAVGPRRVRRGARAAARAAAQAERAIKRRRAFGSAAAASRRDRRRRDYLTRHGGLDAPPLPVPPDLEREIWLGMQLIITDTSAERGRWSLGCMAAAGYAELAGATWHAAVVPLGDGTHRYDPRGTGAAARRARRVIALGWGLHRLERAGVVRGVGVCVLMRMIRDVEDGDPYCRDCGHHHPSRSAWNHCDADGSLETGVIGYGVALELAGAITRHQWRTPAQIAAHCEAWEIGDSGYPTNEYWIVGRDRAGRAADGLNVPPALVVHYAMLRDLVDAALDVELPFVRAPYGTVAALRAMQHAQAPP